MTANPDFELLQEAAEYIRTLPSEIVTLDWSLSMFGDTRGLGTAHHPACWMSLSPYFQERGLAPTLRSRRRLKCLTFKGQSWPESKYAMPLAQLFRLPKEDAIGLFAERGTNFGETAGGTCSDKDVWLRREQRYLDNQPRMAANPLAA